MNTREKLYKAFCELLELEDTPKLREGLSHLSDTQIGAPVLKHFFNNGLKVGQLAIKFGLTDSQVKYAIRNRQKLSE